MATTLMVKNGKPSYCKREITCKINEKVDFIVIHF